MPDGQFGDNAYNNPQMNQYGANNMGNNWDDSINQYNSWLQNQNQNQQGYTPPQGWGNTSSADYQWLQGFKPGELGWQGGDAPGHIGQTGVWNPNTGEFDYINTAGGTGVLTGGMTPYGPNALSYTDPNTGLQMTNLGALGGVMGSLERAFGGSFSGNAGQFNPQQYQMTEYSGPQINAPGGYGGFDYSTIGSGIDPSKVIAAQEYRLQEAMEGDMARAGGRLGQSGMAMSTPYAAELGSAARKASQDRNALTMQYQYDASQQQAQRDLAQQLQAGQHDFGGWQTQGGWDMGAQMANQNQALQQWALQNQMGMGNVDMQNQYGYQGFQDQQNQQQMQQQMMASILGGLF